MAAEKLPTQATGANIRSAINTHADEIDGINEALSQKADLSGGKLPVTQLPPIPEENLPDVNIFQQIFDSFEPGTVEIGATGKIQIVGSVPPSEYTLTLNITGLPTDVPVTVNGEAWENRQKSFASGTVIPNLTPVASGYSLDPASVASVTVDSSKTLNFTATEVDPGDLVPVTALQLNTNINITENNFAYNNQPTIGYGISVVKIPSGGIFEVKFSAENGVRSGLLSVSVGNQQQGQNTLTAGIKWNPDGATKGKFSGTTNGTGIDDYTNRDYTGTAKGRIIGDGTNIKLQRSLDNETSWQDLDSEIIITQPQQDMYIKMLFDENDTKVLNLLAAGVE